MEIYCKFCVRIFDSKELYACVIEEAILFEKDQVIKEFKGVHEKDKSHNDVQCFYFTNTSRVNHFPRGLQRHFPNITHLTISDCGITEITRKDLKGLEGLVRLYIENCQLTSLPDDLFTKMPNLLEVSFVGNKIEFASSELLKPLLRRENVKVDLRGNKNIHAWFWPGGGVVLGFLPIGVRSLKSLEELMTLIDEKCIKPIPPTIIAPDPVDFNPKLKQMWTSGKFSDLTIIAGNKEFKVHKAILGMESEVFAQIFEDQSEITELKIPDFSSNSVEALLKFVYTNEVAEDGNAKENYEISEKFKVNAMKSFYEKIISDQLEDSNAMETFLFAHRVSSQLLKEKAFKLIVQQIAEEVPDKLMEDPENLKKLLDYRRGYEEILSDK